MKRKNPKSGVKPKTTAAGNPPGRPDFMKLTKKKGGRKVGCP
jgi:hypothetical protein